MTNARFELALKQVTASHWRRFELFASEFLVADFPNIRTTASPSGDGGRDAELFTFEDELDHALQYSVTGNWSKKLRETAKRLSETFPSIRFLTYATNIQIGAQADELKIEIRNTYNLRIDIRDQNYFVERFRGTVSTLRAAEALAQEFVDPLLARSGEIKNATAVLSGDEYKAALLFLGLQLHDDTQEKGLTKLSFEALVRSALVGVSSENPITKAEILSRIRALLPSDDPDRVDKLTANALKRLTKRFIRHYPKEDKYCLTHEEFERSNQQRSECAVKEARLQIEIESIVSSVTGTAGDIERLAIRVRRVLEKSLYDRAEAFATAVLTQKIAAFALDDISEVARRDLANSPEQRGELKPEPELITAIIREVLASNGAEILEYLHNLSDAHTLMAFLRSTPDVQSAMSKVFSHGEISLDTTVLLPLIAEELLEGPRRFQKIIEASTHAGISFFATPGVLEELESHLKRGLAYDRIASSNWEGDIPFIYEAYARTGADPGSFRRWIEEFMGDARPIDDLSAYLSERFKIATLSLEAELAATDQELRVAVDEIWQLLHEERRERKTQNTYLDPIKINRLAKHDTENYLGIIQRRAKEATSPLGYSAWWLTFDRAALKIGDRLRSQYELPAPLSPVLSLDFLAQCLSFGSIRAKVSKEAIQSMPILIEPRTVSFLTPELLSEAATMRETMTGMSERVISRRVRDHLDEARRRMGPMAQRGVESYFDEL